MGKLSTYKVELKNMREDTCHYGYDLDNDFFASIDAPEIQKGRLHVDLDVRKGAGVYVLDFHTEGTVVVTCDRCLDEMDIQIQTDDTLKVKLGAAFSDEDDMVVVPEDDGYINVAWFMYEFIALNIPMKHVHAPGQCNKSMMGALGKHLRVSADEEDYPEAEDEMDIDDTEPDGRETDPRWDELKKISNNN